MNRMDDDRHARAFGGEAAKNSRLAAMGVDNLRLLFAENIFEFPQRERNLLTDEPGGRVRGC